MLTIVSNDPRIPLELCDLPIYRCDLEEFLNQACSEDGMEVNDSVWFDVSCLSLELYKSLSIYDDIINMVYYRFVDAPKPNFRTMNTKVIKEYKNTENVPYQFM